MKQLVSGDISTVWDWLSLIFNKEPVEIIDRDLSLDFFGDKNEIFLVINHYLNDSEADQYVFDTEIKTHRLKKLIGFLSSCEYSLDELMNKLDKADFVVTDVGKKFSADGLDIYYTNEKAG